MLSESDEHATVHRMAPNCYIYFLVHASHERFKVGISTNPLSRWTRIQPHAEIDFAASLVFDVRSDVRAGWAEEWIHRELSRSRFEMPSHLDGHTEWFDYSVFDDARAFASSHRESLGISEGYAIAAPLTPAAARSRERARDPQPASRVGRSVTYTQHNESAADVVESYVEVLDKSDALLGLSSGNARVNLYLRRDRMSTEKAGLRPDPPSLIAGPRVAWILGGMRANDRFIRLSIEAPFYASPELDSLVAPGEPTCDPSESWITAAPGFERIRSAFDGLVAGIPRLPAGHPAAALDTVGRS